MCPKCNAMIPFYDNIPVLSFILLNRKCRYCKTPIPFRYPLVELLGGLFALAVIIRFGFGIEALVYYIFISALLVITFIDIDHQIIPDRISLPGIPFFFLAALPLPGITVKSSLLGILGGGTAGGLLGLLFRLDVIVQVVSEDYRRGCVPEDG